MNAERLPRDLIALQIETLYQTDGEHLRCINEPEQPPAPLLFFGRTVQGHVWRFRVDVPPAIGAAVALLCQAEPISDNWSAPPQHAQAIADLLSQYQPVQLSWRGPAYVVPASADSTAGGLLIDANNAHLLRAAFPYTADHWQTRQPCVALVVDRQAVAVCFSARTARHAAEAGVVTDAAQRGKGYARTVVAHWAAAVRQTGRVPLYSTSWDNHAAQGVARSLGMQCYGEDCSFGAE